MSKTFNYQRPWLYPKQQAAIFHDKRYGLIEASAQPLDTACQTPNGERPFGELSEGDEIFAGNGEITRVTGVFPLGDRLVYCLTFSDGTSTRACGEHLWEIDHYRDRKKVVSTDYLRSLSPGSLAHLRFPVCGELQYRPTPVPIDPWLLGVLIGDGSLCGNTISFSSADPEIIERVKSSIPHGYQVIAGGNYSYRISALNRGAAYELPSIRFKANGYEVNVGRQYVGRTQTKQEALTLHSAAIAERYGEFLPAVNLRRELRKLGLLGLRHHEKFIPDIYKFNSTEVRKEILRGIMDTDGSSSKYNGAVLHQTSERLARDVEIVARSLGAFAKTINEPPRCERWKPTYRTVIRKDAIADFFWLPRKRQKSKPSSHFVRKLVSIIPLGLEPVRCISVAHLSSLYLTDFCLVTHNTKAGKTVGSMAWLFEKTILGKPNQNRWWVAPVYPQAKIAYTRLKNGLPRDIFKANDTDLHLTLANQTHLWFKSGEKPDNLYGEDVYDAVIDEASRLREESWHAIRSTMTQTRGQIRMIGNVKGRANWHYKLCRRAQAGDPEMEYHKITAYDAVEAGVLAAKEIEDAKRTLPDHVFRELYLAEPSDDGGNPFGLAAIQKCIGPLSANLPRCWGIDLAKSHDWTVAIALDDEGNICRFERFQKPWEDTIRHLRQTVNEPALVDSTGVGDPVLEALQQGRDNFEGFKFSSTSKQQIMEGLAVAIQQQEIHYPEGAIVNELEAFEYEFTRTGVRYSSPDGLHDDCVCALALANRKRTQPGVGDNVLAFYEMLAKQREENNNQRR